MSRLQAVLSGNLCSGCGLCAALLGPERASMAMDGDGYLRPRIKGAVTAAEDDLIASACPGSAVKIAPGTMIGTNPEWGPLHSTATGYATDEALRHKASSGGALSAVLQSLLSTGKASYVLQVSANPEVPWLNSVTRSSDNQSVYAASGSRYAPSSPLESIIACLDEGKPFVFVGKPCDVAALAAYGAYDKRVGDLVVAKIAFMCGGIPSAKGVELLIRRMGANPSDVSTFRYRGEGWPGLATAVSRDGSIHSMAYNDAWGGILSKHVQMRCKICVDGIGMSADIVCADAWYGDASGYPLFDEQDGRSLVLARTEQGEALLQAAEAQGQLVRQQLDGKEIDRMQPYQLRRTRLVWSRLLAMRLMGRATPFYSKSVLWSFARKASLLANAKSFAGTLRRLFKGNF